MRSWEPGYARPGRRLGDMVHAHCYVQDCGAWLGCAVQPMAGGGVIVRTFPGFTLKAGVVQPLNRRRPAIRARFGQGTDAIAPVDAVCQGCGRRQTVDAEHVKP